MNEGESQAVGVGKKIKIGAVVGFAAYILYSCVAGGSESFQDNKGKSLKEFHQLTIAQRHEIIDDYASDHSISTDTAESFYSCISQMIHTKSSELVLGEIAGWCKSDYEQGNLSGYVNFDEFEKGFSPWDGSFRPLEKQIKKAMNDPDSYEHVKTTYRFILHGVDTPKAIVSTEFRGKNNNNALIKNNVKAAVNIRNGEIIEFL